MHLLLYYTSAYFFSYNCRCCFQLKCVAAWNTVQSREDLCHHSLSKPCDELVMVVIASALKSFVPDICHCLSDLHRHFLCSTNETWEILSCLQLNTLISYLSLRPIFLDYRWCSPHPSEAGVSGLCQWLRHMKLFSVYCIACYAYWSG